MGACSSQPATEEGETVAPKVEEQEGATVEPVAPRTSTKASASTASTSTAAAAAAEPPPPGAAGMERPAGQNDVVASGGVFFVGGDTGHPFAFVRVDGGGEVACVYFKGAERAAAERGDRDVRCCPLQEGASWAATARRCSTTASGGCWPRRAEAWCS